MLYFIWLVLSAVVSIQARTFHNPILSDKPYYEPGAIKVNGTYYVVASARDTSDGIFPIHTSTDLMEWKSAGFVFDGSNAPTWARSGTFYYPDIHQVGPNFLVFFSAYNTTGYILHIGVAIAAHPLGPYSSIDRPIVSLNNTDSRLASIINDEGKLYLLWSKNTTEIVARQLNPHGLSFSSEQTVSLLKPSLDWENENVFAPWYIRRANYHYLIYSGYWQCGGASIGVARSSDALGPYEKKPNPIITPNSTYGCTLDGSVVKDLDDENDLIFFNAYRIDDPDKVRSVVLASLSWSADDWPEIGEF